MSPRTRHTSLWEDDDEHIAADRARLHRLLYVNGSVVEQHRADMALRAALREKTIDPAAVHAALEAGADPDRPVAAGFPPLHIAVHRGDIRLAQALLAHRAAVNYADARGETALDAAYRKNDTQMLSFLVQYGARRCKTKDNVRQSTDGLTEKPGSYQENIDAVFMQAIRDGGVDAVKNALLLGANVNVTGVYHQGVPEYPPLHKAIAKCDIALVDVLLQAGADVQLRGLRGESALDTLWWCKPSDLFSDAWLKIHEKLEARGAQTLFSKHPAHLKMDDLRTVVPIGLDGQTTLMHYLVRMGKGDMVLKIAAAEPDKKLTTDDFRRRSPFYQNQTLWEAFAAHSRLRDVFTVAVWQGRVEEMAALYADVQASPVAARQVDFRQAREDVLRQHLREKTSHLRLRGGPPKGKSGP